MKQFHIDVKGVPAAGAFSHATIQEEEISLNQKLERTIREIERTKAKIAELQAALPALEKQKTELENAEIVKVFRTANVTPEELTAFIDAYKTSMGGGAPIPGQPASQTNTMEDTNEDEE